MESDTQPKEVHKPPFHVLLFQRHRKHTVLFTLGLLAVLSMGTYVYISPTQEIRTQAQEPVNTPTPSTAPPTPTNAPNTPTPTPTTIPTPTLTPTPTVPPGTAWKTYTSKTYGFRIKYPPDWTVQNLGALEPKIPSYIVFNPASASESARSITIGITTRTYGEQLALGASPSAITIAKIQGTKQSFQDSDGNTSTVITLPRSDDLIVLRAKTAHLTIFNFMLSTLK